MFIFVYVLWFLFALFNLILTRFLMRKFKRKLYINIILIVVEIFASIGCAFFVMTTPNEFAIIHPLVSVIYIVTFMDAFARIIYLIFLLVTKKEHNYKHLSIITIFLSIIFLVYGIINMQLVTPKYINIESEKLNNEYKIVFISDMHIGSSQSLSTSKNTINKIKEINPDFVFLGGDIIDTITKKDDISKVLNEFKDIDAKKYYIDGNHDVESKYYDELKQCLINNDIKIVKDEFISLAPDLTLLGREDDSVKDRISIDELINPYVDTYLIALDHQPFKFKDNCKAKVDLQLSGHTHAGQLFPLRMIYDIKIYSYGEYKYNDSILNVSSGASGWLIPFRTEIGCQFEVINLKPKN